jgi:hypothetical protein
MVCQKSKLLGESHLGNDTNQTINHVAKVGLWLNSLPSSGIHSIASTKVKQAYLIDFRALRCPGKARVRVLCLPLGVISVSF